MWALAITAFGAVPAPNAVVSGSRPSPYGFYVPNERYAELLRRHSLAIWLDRPKSVRAFCEEAWIGLDRIPSLRSFNRDFGLELPENPDADMPTGKPIWIPPLEPDAGTCCVWLWSRCDGWVSARPAGSSGIEHLEPTSAHAAFDSGSIDVRILAVPHGLQRQWLQIAKTHPPYLEDLQRAESTGPELRALAQALWQRDPPASLLFSFSQWVAERSKVARMVVSLPIADVAGEVKFVESPSVRWLDAYGKDTSPQAPETSQLFLVLVSVSGGALLGYLLFTSRRRAADAYV